jgi:predicted murein hydrolase (TIGR00659 family)
MPEIDSMLQALLWSAGTIALYLAAKRVYRRWPFWWSSPLIVAPLLLITIALALHESYRDYIHETHWLVTLLGPATVAFAVPIWERRQLIRRYWPLLIVGIAIGSTVAMTSAWAFARVLRMDESLRLSLLPRSISTPFAMSVSGKFGGVPELTAIFVIFTGVFGASLGELLMRVLPLRSVMARGALFGMGAHAVGTAKACEIGHEEGAIAGLVMALAGLTNVLAAPVVTHLIR